MNAAQRTLSTLGGLRTHVRGLLALTLVGAMVLSGIALLGGTPVSGPSGTPPPVSGGVSGLRTLATNYSLTFSESGLPSGTSWEVRLGGGIRATMRWSTTSTVGFAVANGEYPFTTTANASYVSTPGVAWVNGSAVTVYLAFGTPYRVTFNETGLPSGGTWDINTSASNGGWENITSGTSWSMDLPNGKYYYSIGVGAPDIATPSSGSYNVNASNVTLAINFSTHPSTYPVSFLQYTLPAGTNWSVQLNNVWNHSSMANNTGINFYMPNGTFPYLIPASGNYTPSVGTGYVTVIGGGTPVIVTFCSGSCGTNYTVSFTESGLANGTGWTVYLNGVTLTSTGSTIQFAEPSGRYAFYVSPVTGYNVTPSTGYVSVNGSAATVAVTFRGPSTNYGVSFTQSTLPNGTSWSVDLAGTTRSSSTGTVGFSEPDGSYAWTIGTVGHYVPATANGTTVVSGGSVTVVVGFCYRTCAANYSIVFNQSVLPNGTVWTVTIGGLSASSNSSTVTLDETNGTYSWTATTTINGTNYTVQGNVTVKGQSVTVSVGFQVPAAPVRLTFRAVGIAPGDNWSVTLSATSSGETIGFLASLTRWSDGASTIAFEVTPGAYQYTATVPGHAPTSGSITMVRVAQTVDVSAGPLQPTTGPNSLVFGVPGEFLAIGALFVAIGAAGIGFTAYRWRAQQRSRGRRLVERLGETKWTADPDGEPTLRSDR
jgi:hypothetical protein